MAYSEQYGIDYGPRWTCYNCGQPSGMQGHARGDGWSCERPAHLLAQDVELRAERDLRELRNRNLGDARFDLAVLARLQRKRARQWQRLGNPRPALIRSDPDGRWPGNYVEKIPREAFWLCSIPLCGYQKKPYSKLRLRREQRRDGLRPVTIGERT